MHVVRSLVILMLRLNVRYNVTRSRSSVDQLQSQSEKGWAFFALRTSVSLSKIVQLERCIQNNVRR